jgi:pimeloyl-ACP methyl ester carboxylesterase
VAPPSVGRALAAGISGARYVEIAGAAHGVTIQCAERVNGLLREHFQDAEGRAPLQETGRGPLA